MIKQKSKHLEIAKSIFAATAKRLRRRLERRFINAVIGDFYPDFTKGVFVVRLTLHGRSITKRFGLFTEPEEIYESLDDTLNEKLQEIFAGCSDGGDC